MKIIRKILVFILGFVLFNLVGAFFLSISIKNIVQEEVIGSVIKQSLVSSIQTEQNITPEQQEIISKALDNEQIDKLLNNVTDELINTLGTDNQKLNSESINDLIDYFIENKEVLEQITGTSIAAEDLEKFKSSEEYQEATNAITKSINETSKQLSPTEKKVIQGYSYMISDNFKLVILGCIAINILLIAFIQWSLYKWLAIAGRSLYMTGITLIVMYFGMGAISQMLLQEVNMSIELDANNILLMGIGTIIFGLLLVVWCKIITNLINIHKKKIYS